VEFPGHDGCSAGAEALEGRAVTLFSAQDDDVDTLHFPSQNLNVVTFE
jgi:hypothetical protein